MRQPNQSLSSIQSYRLYRFLLMESYLWLKIEDFMKFRFGMPIYEGISSTTNRWGIMAQLDYTQGNLVWKSTHIGCKVGPRLSLQNTGFEGWSLSAYGILGYTNCLSLSLSPIQVGCLWCWNRNGRKVLFGIILFWTWESDSTVLQNACIALMQKH